MDEIAADYQPLTELLCHRDAYLERFFAVVTRIDPVGNRVDIVGLDRQADGGTHVSNTSEIGLVRIPKYKSKGAINKRLYVEITSDS